jgi:hypothetical protein
VNNLGDNDDDGPEEAYGEATEKYNKKAKLTLNKQNTYQTAVNINKLTTPKISANKGLIRIGNNVKRKYVMEFKGFGGFLKHFHKNL